MANLHSNFDVRLGPDATGNADDFVLKLAEADFTSLNYTMGRSYKLDFPATITVGFDQITSARCIYITCTGPFDAVVTDGVAATIRVRTATATGRLYKLILEGCAATGLQIVNQGASGAVVRIGLYGTGTPA